MLQLNVKYVCESQRSEIRVVKISVRHACGVKRIGGKSNESVHGKYGMSSIFREGIKWANFFFQINATCLQCFN